MYTKRKDFETQRAKPWHIIKDSKALNTTYCGCYPYAKNNTDFLRWHAVVDELPEAQIICSKCEKQQQRYEQANTNTTETSQQHLFP